VPGPNILEIEIEPDLIPPKPLVETKPKQSFIDPAILSYGKPDIPSSQISQGVRPNNHQAIEPDKSIPAPVQTTPNELTAPTLSLLAVPAGTSENSPAINPPMISGNLSASATLTGPFNDISLNGIEHHALGAENHTPNDPKHVQSHDQKQMIGTPALKTRGKRAGRNPRRRETLVSTPTQMPTDIEIGSTPLSTQKRHSNNKKGWRQTPLLEEPHMANIHVPRAHRSLTSPDLVLRPGSAARHSKPTPEPTKARRRRYKEEDEQNGWATGEATDIQDMGDFDFEENHKKFDKRKVFDQIRRDDTTADEARLVSFNRLPSARAGTAGGKNLHYTENVLDSPIKKNVGHSSGDSEVDISEDRISSGRSLSRASTRRKVPSRKGSALVKTSFEGIASPKLKTDSSTSQRKGSVGQVKPTLLISASQRVCPCISPLQMNELEQLAITELGLTEDIMTENAARSVAQTAYGLTLDDDIRQSTTAHIVILAGNNKTGSRAIATSRHLRNHGARVVLCVLGLEREDDLIDSVRRQLKLYRNCGGQPIKQDALMKTLRKLQAATDLIIDALLGIHISFDDLRTDDQAAYFQLVCWANGSDADILALDIASGVDASTGE